MKSEFIDLPPSTEAYTPISLSNTTKKYECRETDEKKEEAVPVKSANQDLDVVNGTPVSEQETDFNTPNLPNLNILTKEDSLSVDALIVSDRDEKKSEEEAQKVINQVDFTPNSNIFDIHCGDDVKNDQADQEAEVINPLNSGSDTLEREDS